MKSLIIYYSQTGNTGKVARAIHKGIRGLVDACDIAPVKEVLPQELERYDLIGIGSPVWCGAETPNLRSLVESLPDQRGKQAFCFNTHGVMPELYFPTVVRRLKAKGFTVIGMHDWYGDCRIQTFPSPYYTHDHPDDIDLEEAEAFGREMADKGQRIAAGESDLIPPVPELVLAPQLLALVEFYRWGHSPHGRMTYDPEKCAYPKCSLCMDNCLMNYIDLSASPRCFGSEKTYCDMWLGCTFCELIRPTGAISCDWEQIAAEMALLHQVIGFEHDFFTRQIEEAEAAGRFRMLVPKDEVRWDRPYLMTHNKHPRFKTIKEGE